jgi:CubicO group peptidase (beta-lactamase class C family)
VVNGTVDPGFEPVRAAFERCFAELGETGASFAAIARGRVVADLWGGEGFEHDSIVNVYSVTKALSAFCVMVLVDRGLIALDDTVAEHWPEFAAAGKESITVRQLLSHQAGLVALRQPLATDALVNWSEITGLLAAEEPWWEPGTAHAEHALFYGHLCGELVRRVDDRTLGTFWRDEVAGPWSLDLQIGLTDAEQARAADLRGEIVQSFDGQLYRQALDNPPGLNELAIVNGREWREAEIPAVNGHGTAMAVARFYAGLVGGGELDGVRVVGPATVDAMTAGEMTGPDLLIGQEYTWGLGVAIESDGFGMGGVGGSLGWADPDLGGFAYGYVTRQMGEHDRALAMDAAVRAVLRG